MVESCNGNHKFLNLIGAVCFEGRPLLQLPGFEHCPTLEVQHR